MEDIGMHPDYRSGRDHLGRCDICDCTGDSFYLERCDCGRDVCPDCRTEDDGIHQVVCLVCEGA